MSQSRDSRKLTGPMARRFAWLSVVVAAAAFVVWGATLCDVLVQDWMRGAGAGFCAIALSVIAFVLMRIGVRPIG
jgi:ABC-type uncharacterized transport system permease subunit